MSEGEVRVTSETGGQKGQKPERFDLLPVEPLREVARLYGKGAEKYADRNWERGYDWGLSFAAMQRHALAFWGGESIDPENQSHHLASVIFHAMALMEYERLGRGTDSRSPSLPFTFERHEATWPDRWRCSLCGVQPPVEQQVHICGRATG